MIPISIAIGALVVLSCWFLCHKVGSMIIQSGWTEPMKPNYMLEVPSVVGGTFFIFLSFLLLGFYGVGQFILALV